MLARPSLRAERRVANPPPIGQRHRPNSRRLVVFGVLTICLAISGWNIARKATWQSSLFASAGLLKEAAEVELDQRLQHAASVTLGDRRGTIIVMDPQSGRVRAVVNSTLAFEETLRPGSTIKPFTALAALRSGLIDEESRTLCRETYAHEEFHTTCSHPRDLPPLNPTEAIAYSCNYYFGKLGERLNESSFTSTLNEFGFGKESGVNVEHEVRGQLLRSEWRSENAIGETDNLQATPIQLITAYSALVNGGHLFTPRIASARGFVPAPQANLAIKDEYRTLIVKGMRGAVRYGTAESANLYSLPIYIFGKTGTANQINGFRTQGLFVGFASQLQEDSREADAQAPENVRLAVLVLLTRAHGSEAAQLARPIFEEYARSTTEIPNGPKAQGLEKEASESQAAGDALRREFSRPRFPESPSHVLSVRVHLVRENVTRTIALEDYVRGVVATEGSMESEVEALKALAIVARTFALKNIGRHAQDGYDFCTTTHCQRFRPPESDPNANISPAVSEAVKATRGEVLLDDNNQLADSYFGASCGGATANIGTLWGANMSRIAPAYLRGVPDEYCASAKHHRWTDVISRTHLLQALQSDPRTNVGNRLLSVAVTRRDESGRAELITIEGDRRLTVKGWDFKIIVGRALGWNLLKSSRFELSHSGSNFVFRGSGFGHGLGLCQEGAHVMAARGANYRQILAKYFPTTHITNGDGSASADLMWGGDEPVGATTGFNFSRGYAFDKANRHTLRSEYFQINYPDNVSEREVEGLLNLLQSNRKSLIGRVAAAGVNVQFPSLEIFINETTGDFVGRTGQPAWAAAATKGSRVELQPLATLRKRRILETTLRHELVHAVVDAVGRGHAPRWLAEGLAITYAGEDQIVARYGPGTRMKPEEIEHKLLHAKSADDMRQAYAAAYGEVRRLINNEGEASVWRRVAN
ncbi:MAG: SpoIID/LytB domain-containing protein [Acidobacteriota bacterium]|nr:SpoIID/LytB domain-containing protein [Acidobacteriota bacterium]